MTQRILILAAAVIGATALASPVYAGPIMTDIWYEFSFGAPGTSATGCFPVDPAGDACVASTGTPTTFLDAPSWTFTAGESGAVLTVTDAFDAGDQFELLDFGVPIGFTSLPVAGVGCGNDPVPCLADPEMSHGLFILAAGDHAITIAPSADGFGAGYLIVESVQSVPEPATLVLLGTGTALTFWRTRRHGAR